MKHRPLIIFASSIIFLLGGCGLNEAKYSESDSKKIVLLGPEEGAYVDLLNDPERRYINAMHAEEKNMAETFRYRVNTLGGDTIKIKDYLSSYSRGKNRKIQLGFDTEGYNKDHEFVYHLATKEDFSDEITYQTKDYRLDIHSLKIDTKYYWKVNDTKNLASSPVKSFVTMDGFRGMDAGRVDNVRDLGGKPVKGGKRIKQGLIYRGSELNKEDYSANGGDHKFNLDDMAKDTFANIMHVNTEIDFRGDEEANQISKSNLESIENYNRQPIAGYGGLITSKSQYPKVKAIFEEFLTAKEDSSVYFHCWGGADRTGSIAFLLGGLLGMSYTDLVIDFELTSFSYNLREHDKIGEYSDFPSLIEGLKTISQTEETYPDIQNMVEYYLTNKVGLTLEQLNTIKDNMLEEVI